MRTYTTITDKGRFIRADYAGGPYIELTFGTTSYAPTEVINVWDYETGQVGDQRLLVKGLRKEALRLHVKEWILSNEEEGWNDWYEDYLRNARY